MSVIQYVGARYVPKFYENPNGGSDWVSGVIYEPLTIVTYLNASYTSKKSVPANIGNPASNPEYWVATGNYTQQVEEYRQQVVALSADFDTLSDTVDDALSDISDIQTEVTGLIEDVESAVDALENLNIDTIYKGSTIHVYGDSNAYIDFLNNNEKWFNIVAGVLGCTVNNHSTNGSCWLEGIGTRGQFLAQVNATQVDENAKLAMIMGGINDFHYGTYNASAYATAISDTISAIHTKLPNAVIVVMMDCGSQMPNAKLLNYEKMINRYGTLCGATSANYVSIVVPLGDLCCLSEAWYNTNHYSASGNRIIARRILDSLIGNGAAGGVSMVRTSKDYTQASPTSTGFYNCGYRCATVIDAVKCVRTDDIEFYTDPGFGNTDGSTASTQGQTICDELPILINTLGEDNQTRNYWYDNNFRRSSGENLITVVPLVYNGTNYNDVNQSPKALIGFQYPVTFSPDMNGRMRIRWHFVSGYRDN